ncbi:hypothetical protein SAMN05444358_1227 [Ruegeria halocynthiae]|uniref:SnoaL-like domain-containing protein n=1 Tax=Ruegeria halocynthiae TaxID=985054 RepID=A0A1H3G0R5_9RHOB|nr:nuclear transport factor 2 family protein [Ruegeria halocynthiae]SDX96740.1 hypothetical protein SAMN05444358_1227 [Ruegeria halocynthiae]
MSTANYRKTVTAFFDRFSAGDSDGVLALLDDAASWKVMGRDGALPISGEMNKEGVAGLMSTVAQAFPQGMTLTPSGWTSEGERVAVEVESYGVKADGLIYNNLYHFLFVFCGERIVLIREYMDTLHVKSVFIDG